MATWNYETTGEFGIYADADSDGNLIASGTVVSSKSKTIKNIKTPSQDEDATNWNYLFAALLELFSFNGEIRYFRGKAGIEY